MSIKEGVEWADSTGRCNILMLEVVAGVQPGTDRACGALRREFVACLRSGRALPAKAGTEQACRAHHRRRRAFRASRPGSRPGRARPLGGQPDHRHRPVGDLVPLVERRSRSTLLVHLLRLDGWGEKPTVKNGPALGGSGAVAMNAALVASMTDLPQQLRRTLAWDRGKELSGRRCTSPTRTRRGSGPPTRTPTACCASTLPGGTGLSRCSAEDLEAVALAINNRPRKVSNRRTPTEVFSKQLRYLEDPGVASPG